MAIFLNIVTLCNAKPQLSEQAPLSSFIVGGGSWTRSKRLLSCGKSVPLAVEVGGESAGHDPSGARVAVSADVGAAAEPLAGGCFHDHEKKPQSRLRVEGGPPVGVCSNFGAGLVCGAVDAAPPQIFSLVPSSTYFVSGRISGGQCSESSGRIRNKVFDRTFGRKACAHTSEQTT